MTALIEAEAPFESDELGLSDYIAIVKRRWWLILAGALLLALAAFIYSMLQTRVYRASSDVLIRTQANDELFPSVPFTQDSTVLRKPLSEQEFIESDQFDAALIQAGATANIGVTVSQVDDGDRTQTGNTLTFTATGPSAISVADSANIAADTYIAERQASTVEDVDRRTATEIDELAERQNRLALLDRPVDDLQRQIDEAETSGRNDDANRFRDELSALRANLTADRIDLQQQIDSLTSRVSETADFALLLENPDISARVSKVAGIPGSPVTPKTLRNVLLGAMLGTLCGLGAGVLWESIDDKVTSEDDITNMGLNVLASVPVDGIKVDGPRLFASEAESGREMEAYRTARAALNFTTDGRLTSFLVTSGLPSEGKSTTSANLAVALSLAGQKTLLIDADMRRPTLHKYFDIPNNVGLRSILTGEADANDVMAVTGFGEMLALISAGATAPYPSELLSNGRLESLISGAKEVFDVVIVDTPPLFLVSDAALVAPSVDGIVLSMTSGMEDTSSSKKSDTRRLIAAVRKLRTPLLGAVLHGGGVGSYGYGSKYGYYSADESSEATTNNGRGPQVTANGSEPENVGWVEDRINVR